MSELTEHLAFFFFYIAYCKVPSFWLVQKLISFLKQGDLTSSTESPIRIYKSSILCCNRDYFVNGYSSMLLDFLTLGENTMP